MKGIGAPESGAGSSPMRLAIIDDHELVREGLAALLASHAARDIDLVYSGGTVADALATQPTVALLDVDLGPGAPPVAEGTGDLTAHGVGVLLISAYDDAAAVRNGLKAGALGFVAKRVSYDTLVDALKSTARGELYLTVDLAAILATAADTPDLSPRELDALRLYASGLKLSAVAHRMGISPHTAKEYLDRVRSKYAHVGRPARTRTELYAAATRDGLLDEPPFS
jgi:DNA-binding NarL/FixJ family response regulator